MTRAADPIIEARAALRRYLARFPDEAEAVAPLHAQLADDGDILLRANMRGHITTSALVLDPTMTRALVIHHRVFDAWLQPGGHYEPPGSLWDSACREVTEETGLLHIRPFGAVDPIDIDTHSIPAHPRKAETAHRHHDFAYLAIGDAEFVAQPQLDEVHAVEWIALDELMRYPNARVRRLATKAARTVARHT